MKHIIKLKGQNIELTTKQLWKLYDQIRGVLGDNLEPPTQIDVVQPPQCIEVTWPFPLQPPFLNPSDPSPFFKTICESIGLN